MIAITIVIAVGLSLYFTQYFAFCFGSCVPVHEDSGIVVFHVIATMAEWFQRCSVVVFCRLLLTDWCFEMLEKPEYNPQKFLSLQLNEFEYFTITIIKS